MRPALLGLLLLLALPAVGRAERYRVKDAGGFQPLGQAVEFADRYRWQSYTVDFDLSLEDNNRSLGRGSKLKLRVERRGGGSWSYTCKAKGRSPMTANINFLYGKGISVVAECPLPPKEFAKAVDLDPADVGAPSLLFQVNLQDGKASPGAQKGVVFAPSVSIDASELNAYAAAAQDGLAVVFRSK